MEVKDGAYVTGNPTTDLPATADTPTPAPSEKTNQPERSPASATSTDSTQYDSYWRYEQRQQEKFQARLSKQIDKELEEKYGKVKDSKPEESDATKPKPACSQNKSPKHGGLPAASPKPLPMEVPATPGVNNPGAKEPDSAPPSVAATTPPETAGSESGEEEGKGKSAVKNKFDKYYHQNIDCNYA